MRVQREEIQSGQKGYKRFEDKGGAGELQQHRGAYWPSSTVAQRIQAGGVREGHSVGRCGSFRRNRDAAGRAALKAVPGVRAA